MCKYSPSNEKNDEQIATPKEPLMQSHLAANAMTAKSGLDDRSWPFEGRFVEPVPNIEAAWQIGPDNGVMTTTIYWRPKANAVGFDTGEKVNLTAFLPCEAGDLCPCGSTKSFIDCCSRKPTWNILVPAPWPKGYDVMRPISVT